MGKSVRVRYDNMKLTIDDYKVLLSSGNKTYA